MDNVMVYHVRHTLSLGYEMAGQDTHTYRWCEAVSYVSLVTRGAGHVQSLGQTLIENGLTLSFNKVAVR